MGKVYAVAIGKQTGIFDTWAECEAQVKGFPNAKYKSFTNREEAESYLYGRTIVKSDTEPLDNYAFVDGSFNPKTNVYGFGGFVCCNGVKHPVQGNGNDPEMASMRNVAGEILGAEAAIKKAIGLGMPKITILYDYTGIEDWALGNWKANKEGTKHYKEAYMELSKSINVVFQKVAAHTGIEGNEIADRLAKKAVGLETDKKYEMEI